MAHTPLDELALYAFAIAYLVFALAVIWKRGKRGNW